MRLEKPSAIARGRDYWEFKKKKIVVADNCLNVFSTTKEHFCDGKFAEAEGIKSGNKVCASANLAVANMKNCVRRVVEAKSIKGVKTF